MQDVEHIYELPLAAARVRAWTTGSCEKLGHLGRVRQPRSAGTTSSSGCASRSCRVTIGIVGKYVHLSDTYKSLNEALVPRRGRQRRQGGALCSSTARASTPRDPERACCPRGRGAGARWLRRARHRGQDRGRSGGPARTSVPFFGICLGMQLAVVEYARNVLGLGRRHSREFDPDPSPRGHRAHGRAAHVVDKGGTMRLGSVPVRAARGLPGAPHLRRRPDRASAIATATRSTPAYHDQLRGRRPACSAACRPTGAWPRWSSCTEPPVVPGLPVPPRVQEPAPGLPTRCSRATSRPWPRSPAHPPARRRSTESRGGDPPPRVDGPVTQRPRHRRVEDRRALDGWKLGRARFLRGDDQQGPLYTSAPAGL